MTTGCVFFFNRVIISSFPYRNEEMRKGAVDSRSSAPSFSLLAGPVGVVDVVLRTIPPNRIWVVPGAASRLYGIDRIVLL